MGLSSALAALVVACNEASAILGLRCAPHMGVRVVVVVVVVVRHGSAAGRYQCGHKLRITTRLAGTEVQSAASMYMGRDGASTGTSAAMFLPLDVSPGSSMLADHDHDGTTDAPMLQVAVDLEPSSPGGRGTTVSALVPVAMIIGTAPARHDTNPVLVQGGSASHPCLPMRLSAQFVPASMLGGAPTAAKRGTAGGGTDLEDYPSAPPAPPTTVDAIRAIAALKRHFYIADGTMGGTARAGRLREALEADELVAPYIDGEGADATELADLMGCVGDDAVSWPTYVCGWLCAAGCVWQAVCAGTVCGVSWCGWVSVSPQCCRRAQVRTGVCLSSSGCRLVHAGNHVVHTSRRRHRFHSPSCHSPWC